VRCHSSAKELFIDLHTAIQLANGLYKAPLLPVTIRVLKAVSSSVILQGIP
jgi:hypothetical protein